MNALRCFFIVHSTVRYLNVRCVSRMHACEMTAGKFYLICLFFRTCQRAVFGQEIAAQTINLFIRVAARHPHINSKESSYKAMHYFQCFQVTVH